MSRDLQNFRRVSTGFGGEREHLHLAESEISFPLTFSVCLRAVCLKVPKVIEVF